MITFPQHGAPARGASPGKPPGGWNIRQAIFAIFALVLATSVPAADIAKDPAVHIEGVVTEYPDQSDGDRADAAVVGIVDGTFTNLTDTWAASVEAAGFTTTIIIDPTGDEDYSGFAFILVTCADNWWPSPRYPQQIPLWEAYLDDGGKLILVGQDFLYGSEDYGFPQEYLGMTSAVEDLNFGDDGPLSWAGEGVLDGLGGVLLPCFSANAWFTDAIDGDTALCAWSSSLSDGSHQGGCASAAGIFSTVEFGCADAFDRAVLDEVVAAFVQWLLPVATRDASISALKSIY